MARTSSKEYWRQREEEQRRHNISDECEIQKQLGKIYQSMMDEISKEINGFYGKYARQEGITMTEAMKRAEKLDIEAYARKAKRYVQQAKDERRSPGSTDKGFFSEQANKEMSLYNMTMKVNRLELLKSSIGLEMVRGFDEITEVMDGALYDRATAELARQAGILGKTVQDNAKWARNIVNASFHHARFSDRIWAAQDVLKAELAKELSTGIIQGRHPRVLAANIRKRMGVSQSDAERLMRTELARVQTEAQKVSFQENGYDEYEFIALGSTACSICADLDEKHFKVKDMQIGKNAPPMHPNCRCSIAAWMDRAAFDNWLNEKYNENSYDELMSPTGAPLETYRKKKKNVVYNDLREVNPGYPKDKARRFNCQRCVPAYELRKRKELLDVIARPAPIDSNGRPIYDEAMKNMLNVFVGAKNNLRLAGSFDGRKYIEKRMLEFGPGARAQVFVEWDGGTEEYVKDGEVVNLRKAHTFVAENDEGIVRFVDPQNGNEDCSNYFTKVRNGCTMFVRIDNLPINEDIIDLFVTNRGG